MIIDLFINGKKIQAETAPDQMLIDFLRGLGYKSMKRGCDTGNCGLCTVWMDEKPVLSCSVPAARAAGHKFDHECISIKKRDSKPDYGADKGIFIR